ncbi:hypothetical protein F-M6_0017 [Faustovirus]|nr:hypothetical protein F-M6_0017 [Faustovirus]QJX73792.1 hypothetical protein F-E9_19 [Faustovirus]
MDECLLPTELIVMIADADDVALMRLSCCCKSLFIEFHGRRMTRCVNQYKYRDAQGNLIHIYTNIRNPSKIIQSIKFIESRRTVITVWLNLEGRMYQHYQRGTLHVIKSTPLSAIGRWGGASIEFGDGTEFESQVKEILECGIKDYPYYYAQTIRHPVRGLNVYTNDIIDTWSAQQGN